MITRNMNYDEIAKLFLNDYNNYMPYELEKACTEYKHILNNPRRENRVWYEPYRYHSLNDFNFIITFFTRGINEPEPENVNYLLYAWFWKNGQAYAICIHNMQSDKLPITANHLSIYIPHFFFRYKQRFIKNFKLEEYQVIHQYFLNNWGEALKHVQSKKYPNSIYNVGNDGISFSNYNNPACFEYKTYITWDMLYPDQKKIALEAKMAANALGFDLAVPEDEFVDVQQ